MTESGYKPPELALLGAEHVARYRETEGEVGYEWNGVPTLLLTTSGRKTGQSRTSALIFARDGDDYLVVASMGGAPKHPAWYLNLQVNPRVEIQVKDQHIRAVASTAPEADRERLWRIVTAQWPNYDVYQTRTERVIPIVVLTPA
ncbi:nitroreductase family deazaflavin-dependent oxidoreductase [Nocardia miyunensis]|uniref:nitroreductase family deazaflavin-dependent oxidoreductase n=1 Tax=Nocardia miyunensis TaxID=282684 RepID=UPI00082F4212|nr:nitroreductase family deazaflavin-dependent oxidoreductase [Nocardia miyunensis]